MGLTVRYPNGMTVVFNRAFFMTHGPNDVCLYTHEDGDCIAVIQAGAGVMVEFEPPCTVKPPQGAELAITKVKLRQARKELRELRKPKKR